MKQLNQTPPTHCDLDAIRLDVDPGEKRHQHGAGLVRGHVWKLFSDVAPARDQALLVSAIGMFVANSVKDCALIHKKSAKPIDHQALEIARRDTAAICMVLG